MHSSPSKHENATKDHARDEPVEWTGVAIRQILEGGADGDSEGVGDDNQSRTGFLGDCQHLGRVKLDLACAQLNQGKSQGGEVCT